MKEAQAIERLRNVLRRQHKALATEDCYVLWLRRYIKALSKMSPELPSEKKLEIFLTDLARVQDVSASTQNQAFNAIVYFYKDGLGQPLGNIKALRATRPAPRVVWERDQHNGMPVMLPHALARKYPAYQFKWGWAWLFPAHQPCRDPRSGLIVRYRMHEANVQRAVNQAARRLGICVLPLELRHGFASHSLERGVNPRAIQEVMGHSSLETTMGYMHAEALSVPSPLDALPIILPPTEKGSLLSMNRNPAVQKAEVPRRSSVSPAYSLPQKAATPGHLPTAETAGNRRVTRQRV